MTKIYLAFAIIGAVVPYLFFIDFFLSTGFDLNLFVPALFVNGAAGGFSADLLITSAAFWTYLWVQKTDRLWFYILINLTIGLSCALPAYLYVKSKADENSRVTA